VQIGMLGAFTLLGKLALGFTVSWLQIAIAVLAVCLLDLAFTYWRAGILLVPASGLISGLSLGLLLRSPHWWPFLVAGAVTSLGKQAFQPGGRHVFNPSNFGVVVPWRCHGRRGGSPPVNGGNRGSCSSFCSISVSSLHTRSGVFISLPPSWRASRDSG